jgi:hypothetical protein
MKSYVPSWPRTLDEAAGLAALLQRADACRAQAEPSRESVLVADEEIARRFPYHRRDGIAEREAAAAGERAVAASAATGAGTVAAEAAGSLSDGGGASDGGSDAEEARGDALGAAARALLDVDDHEEEEEAADAAQKRPRRHE